MWEAMKLVMKKASQLCEMPTLLAKGHFDEYGNYWHYEVASSRNANLKYSVKLCERGHSSCTCEDFKHRGRLCKHLAQCLVVSGFIHFFS